MTPESKTAKEFPKIIPLKRTGGELRFTEPTFANANALFNLVKTNRKHLLPWLEWASEKITKSAEDSFRFLDRSSQKWKCGTTFDFGIFLSGALVGRMGVINVDADNKSAEIGYWLAKDAVGKGLVSAGVNAFEEKMFRRDFNRLYIRCDKLNTASAAVARRCGYVLEGELREEHYIKSEDRFRTTLMFSKLAREFERQ